MYIRPVLILLAALPLICGATAGSKTLNFRVEVFSVSGTVSHDTELNPGCKGSTLIFTAGDFEQRVDRSCDAAAGAWSFATQLPAGTYEVSVESKVVLAPGEPVQQWRGVVNPALRVNGRVTNLRFEARVPRTLVMGALTYEGASPNGYNCPAVIFYAPTPGEEGMEVPTKCDGTTKAPFRVFLVKGQYSASTVAPGLESLHRGTFSAEGGSLVLEFSMVPLRLSHVEGVVQQGGRTPQLNCERTRLLLTHTRSLNQVEVRPDCGKRAWSFTAELAPGEYDVAAGAEGEIHATKKLEVEAPSSIVIEFPLEVTRDTVTSMEVAVAAQRTVTGSVLVNGASLPDRKCEDDEPLLKITFYPDEPYRRRDPQVVRPSCRKGQTDWSFRTTLEDGRYIVRVDTISMTEREYIESATARFATSEWHALLDVKGDTRVTVDIALWALQGRITANGPKLPCSSDAQVIFVAGGHKVATPLRCKDLSYSLREGLSGIYDVKAIGLGPTPNLPLASGVLVGRPP